jgi:hypothetical protein
MSPLHSKQSLWQQIQESELLSREYLDTYKNYFRQCLKAKGTDRILLYEKLHHVHYAWKLMTERQEKLREHYSGNTMEA